MYTRFGILFAIASGTLLHAQAPTCPVAPLAAGASVEAAIAATDCRYLDAFPGSRTESRIKQFSLDIAERRVVIFELNSSEFDTILYLFDAQRRMLTLHNDISRENTNSRIAANLPAGSYLVVAAARAADAAGTFQLKASAEAPRNCAERTLEIGQRVEIAFDAATSCRELDFSPFTPFSETLVAPYRLEAPRRGALSIAADVEALLTLTNANDSRQSFRSQDSRLLASVAPGPFVLLVRPATAGTLALETKIEDLRTCEPRALTFGEPITGTIADTDCRLLDLYVPLNDPTYLHLYTFTLAEAAVVTFAMESGEMDTYLQVTTSEGLLIAFNDDTAVDNTNSRIIVNLPPGEYRVVATTFDVAVGGYSLQATREAPRDCAPAVFPLDTAVEGTLAAGGCRVLDMVRFSTAASPAQAYTLTVPERRVAKLDLNIPAGRGTIYVIAGNGAIAASRNTDLDGNAAIETTIPAGEYRLAIASPTDPPPAFAARGTLRVPPECPVTELALGVTTDGRIESTDCRYFEFTPFLTANTRSKRYGFSLSEPSRVVMEMSSTEIEPVLVVTTAEERILGTGVAPAPTTLRLTGTLPAGSYRLAATAARGGLGAFTVLVQAQSASATSALSGANDFAGIVEAIPDAAIDGAAPAPLNWHGPKPPKNRPQ